MSIVVSYLAYLLISVSLTILIGQLLSRSGRLFLLDALGGSDSAARGLSSLIVVTFYLISLGFVALTVRTSGDSLTARQAIQQLATKLGEVLLVLGAMYLSSIVALTRLRRRLMVQVRPGTGPAPGPEPAVKSAPSAGLPPQALWRPAPKRTAQ